MININRLNEVHYSLLKKYIQGCIPQQQHLRSFGTPVQKCFHLSNTHMNSGPPKIHTIRKSLQAISRAIDTHLGGGTLGHLGLIVSDASYAMIGPATYAGPKL
jgi:hypothetical protein